MQEKNITSPTDAKLDNQIVYNCIMIAMKEGLTLRRSYIHTTKQLVRDTYNRQHPRRREKAHSAKRKLKTINGRLVRALERKSPPSSYQETLTLLNRLVDQTKTNKNKIYVLHEAHTYCIAKGKSQKYEYEHKESIVLTQNTGINIRAKTFVERIHDGHTLEGVLDQSQELIDRRPTTATVDGSSIPKPALY